MLSDTTRSILFFGRLVAFAAAVLSIAFMGWQGYRLFGYVLFSGRAAWADVGVLPFVAVLRVAVGVWVAWSVMRVGERKLMLILFAAFGVSFLLLYGWYFLLIGMDARFLYWVVGGDFLYLIAGMVVGYSLYLSRVGPEPGNQNQAARARRSG